MSQRFINIKTFKHGSTAYTTLQRVTENTEAQEIAASGDGDKVDTALFRGKSATRGEVEIQDPVQANALFAASKADITFEGEPEPGSDTVTVTIQDVVFFSKRGTFMHNGLWGYVLGYRAHDPAGAALVAIVTND